METRLLSLNHKTIPLQKPPPAMETHQNMEAKYLLRPVKAAAFGRNNRDWTLFVVPRKGRLGNHEAVLQDH